MSKCFFIPGLGANEIAFSKIGDLGVDKVMVSWIENQPDETLDHYVRRLIHENRITSEDILIGLSFGGIIIQKMAEILNVPFIILVSSFVSKKQLQPIFTFGLRWKLFKLMPKAKVPLLSKWVANYLNSNSEDSEPAIKEMLDDTDMDLMHWSIYKIFELKRPLSPNIKKYNILGNDDKIVNLWNNENTFIIKGGSHFMVYEKANQVTDIILSILKKEKIV